MNINQTMINTHRAPSQGVFKQQGVTLIEVLVAVLVLSAGLLGAVALQFATAKEQRSSQFLSRAVIAANDIAERMRTNRAGLESQLYNTDTSTYTATGDWIANGSAVPFLACVPKPVVNCAAPNTAAQCTQLALDACANATVVQAADAADWAATLRASLPQASLHVLTTAAGAAVPTRDIVIAWVEPVVDKDAAGKPMPFISADKNGRKANSGCPAVIAAPDGVRCYQMRFVL